MLVADKLYSDKEVTDYLGIKLNTLSQWRLRQQARPIAIKVGKLNRTTGSAIQDYLDGCKTN